MGSAVLTLQPTVIQTETTTFRLYTAAMKHEQTEENEVNVVPSLFWTVVVFSATSLLLHDVRLAEHLLPLCALSV